VLGNKRASTKLIGREALVLECKPTGWHTIQLNDTGETVNPHLCWTACLARVLRERSSRRLACVAG
jgi:hypothetical protein